MSRLLEGQQLLLNAAQQLDDLAGHVAAAGEPEEVQQVLNAGQLEDEAQELAAKAQAAPTAQAMAELLRRAEELALQAEQQRQQAAEGLRERAGHASVNMEAAEAIRGQMTEAAGGVPTGDELITRVVGVHGLIDESRTSLAGASDAATERDRTQECLGLIKQAQESCDQAAGMCRQLAADVTDYAGRL
jgi:hypothetical protein